MAQNAARKTVQRTAARRLTSDGTFDREGQTYGPYGAPVCSICHRPPGDPRPCYYCQNGLALIYPALRRERIADLRKQLVALETAALEDMWRR